MGECPPQLECETVVWRSKEVCFDINRAVNVRSIRVATNQKSARICTHFCLGETCTLWMEQWSSSGVQKWCQCWTSSFSIMMNCVDQGFCCSLGQGHKLSLKPNLAMHIFVLVGGNRMKFQSLYSFFPLESISTVRLFPHLVQDKLVCTVDLSSPQPSFCHGRLEEVLSS